MNFGIWAPQPHVTIQDEQIFRAVEELKTVSKDTNKSFELIVDILKKAEGYGFKTSLIAERWLGPDLEAWILASALLSHLKEMELIVAVHPGIFTPQVVAKMSASLDRISGGRAAINIVNGWWAEEFDIFGGNGAWLEDKGDRYQRMEEFVKIINGLWSKKVKNDREFYNSSSLPLELKTATQSTPKIYAASQSFQGKKIIVENCDTWFMSYSPGYNNSVANIEKMAVEIAEMKQLAQQKETQLGYAISALIICENTLEAAEAKVAVLEAYAEKHGGVAKVAAQSLGAGLVGTPEIIAKRINEYEAIGVDTIMLRFNPIMDGLDRFGNEVIPLLGKKLSNFKTF